MASAPARSWAGSMDQRRGANGHGGMGHESQTATSTYRPVLTAAPRRSSKPRLMATPASMASSPRSSTHVATRSIAMAESSQIGRASKLYELLQIFGGLTGEDEIRLDSVLDRALGWRVTVRVHSPLNSRHRDPRTKKAIPKLEQTRYSVIQHLLAADPPISNHSSFISDQGSAINHQPTTPGRRGEVLRRDEIVTGAGVARHTPGSHTTAPVGALQPRCLTPSTGADAQDGIDSTTFSRRVRERFGTTEYQRRGPCPYCHGPTFARFGEEAWCPRCDG